MVKRKLLKRYPLNQSPLYKLRNKRKLAKLFNHSLDDINELLAKENNYRVFDLKKEGKKPRKIEAPFPKLERLHQRIFHILGRINPPSYVFSGIKGRSYIDNAMVHREAKSVYKLDIANFYPSTSSLHVFNFFNKTMKCSKDVSGLLTNISTISGHIPTGSCLSQILAFYTHMGMFEQLNTLACNEDLTMTCYVDDIVFSGENISKDFMFQAKKIITQNHLESKPSKEKFYTGNRAREITGVLFSNGKAHIPNRHHKGIKQGIDDIVALSHQDLAWNKAHQSICGKVISASQIEQSFKTKATHISQLYKTKRGGEISVKGVGA